MAKGTPPRQASPAITKYTGSLSSPEWKDVEPGRGHSSPWYLVNSAQIPTDKFETLCHVEADISGAPYTSKVATMGETGYRRDYDIILLVGLTELKAQVSWIDFGTVRVHSFLRVSTDFTRFPCT